MDRYIEFFFLSLYADSTFYNIGISYVAAYIFYIIQIYIPSVINHNHGLFITKRHIENYINDIQKLILVVDALKIQKKDWNAIEEEDCSFFIINESTNEIFKITFLKTYLRLKKQIIAELNELQTNPLLNYLDSNLSELLYMLPIKEFLVMSDNIYEQMHRLINVDIIDNKASLTIQTTINELQNRYGFSFESFSVTNDINLQSQYVRLSPSMAKYTNDELKIKVKLRNSVD